MGPVVLFEMGIIILLARSRGSEVYAFGVVLKVAYEVMVEELGAIVTIKALEFKRQIVFNARYLFRYAISAFVPGCQALGPTAVIVSHGETPDEVSRKAIATVGDGICFHKSRLSDIPGMGTDRDWVAQSGAGPGT